ncbi:MAG: nicotinamide-nucleotide amidohydrolase family protein [Candidatus Thiodiazotropha sp.]|jgi:nicotinamide-nucleotide amidase
MSESIIDPIDDLVKASAQQLLQRGFRLVVAESCTGGWLAKVLTDLAGSSKWFDRGYITYSNQAKQSMLGVNRQTLEINGAVSEATVSEMTQGALQDSGADVAIAISGIAGPSGGSVEKPVGLVCFSWQLKSRDAYTCSKWFAGDRQQVRGDAVKYALQELLAQLKND